MKQLQLAQEWLDDALLTRCQPFLDDLLAVQSKLCRRTEGFINDLFVVAAGPEGHRTTTTPKGAFAIL